MLFLENLKLVAILSPNLTAYYIDSIILYAAILWKSSLSFD